MQIFLHSLLFYFHSLRSSLRKIFSVSVNSVHHNRPHTSSVGLAPYESTKDILNIGSFTQKYRPRTSCMGFTLIELLVSASIIVIIAGLVLARFTSFDGTVVLRSAAYDVATSLREAQIYSVSVTNALGGESTTFRYPYGLSFVPGPTSYSFYRYDDIDTSVIPEYDGSGATLVRVMPLNGSTQIADLCVLIAGETTPECGLSRLDISFRRPEFAALIYANGASSQNISAAQIRLESSRNPGNVWVVEIKLLGQITVYKL